MNKATVMSSAELRASFIEFFVERGHVHVPSASLIPAHMATTLFTIAGMEPFVPIFLGEVPATWRRAVSVQRCLRVAGAKSDIENVGRTGRHGTLLEMLGNFGFADYGKREAIQWAWEYLTQRLKIDPERLSITVHTGDDEAQEIWEQHIGILESRITRFDDDNFWTMGPTGPCGPSTEIFYDTGIEYAVGPHDTGPNFGNRYVEIWNLVFQQYNREADGRLRELPALNIDTGAGLERVLAVVNGHGSMYETDLFTTIIQAQPRIDSTSLEPKEHIVRQRIIADHVRAATALIADGLFPSNVDRGYVLRFLIRRAIRNGRLLGYPAGFLTALVPTVVASLQSGFPELLAAQERVMGVLGGEEEIFDRTLARGEELLARKIDELRRQKTDELAGADAFVLHDTFGFPIELTTEILAEQGLLIDLLGFTREMEAQRHRARSDAAKKRGIVRAGESTPVAQASVFDGYDSLESEGRILEMLTEDGTPVDEAIAGERLRIVLDHSSFYAERGGQIGDHGTIDTARGARFRVDDTQRIGDAIAHHGVVEAGIFERGEQARTHVDGEWRQEIRRHHTSAHLLQFALREILGPQVVQAGSWVGPDRMRFDFRSPGGALTLEQRQQVSARINMIIRADTEILTRELPLTEARALGALAMAGEAYGTLVRVLQAGPSLELCGGTHAHRTGELGFFIMVSESSIGSGIRRIEGLVSGAAERYVLRQQELSEKLGIVLTCRPEEVVERVERLQTEIRDRDRVIAELQAKSAKREASALYKKAEAIELGHVTMDMATGVFSVEAKATESGHGMTDTATSILYVRDILEDVDPQSLKQDAQQLKALFEKKHEEYVIFLLGREMKSVSVQMLVSAGAVKAGVHAGTLVREVIAPLIDGKGGGTAAQAQGGGSRAQAAQDARDKVDEILSNLSSYKRGGG